MALGSIHVLEVIHTRLAVPFSVSQSNTSNRISSPGCTEVFVSTYSPRKCLDRPPPLSRNDWYRVRCLGCSDAPSRSRGLSLRLFDRRLIGRPCESSAFKDNLGAENASGKLGRDPAAGIRSRVWPWLPVDDPEEDGDRGSLGNGRAGEGAGGREISALVVLPNVQKGESSDSEDESRDVDQERVGIIGSAGR